MAGSVARGRIMAQISAKHPREPGFGHWRWQRISAVATLGLMLYFTYLVASIGPLDYSAAMAFVASPQHAVALAILVIAGLFHAALGVQMIIEDYIPLASGRLVAGDNCAWCVCHCSNGQPCFGWYDCGIDIGGSEVFGIGQACETVAKKRV